MTTVRACGEVQCAKHAENIFYVLWIRTQICHLRILIVALATNREVYSLKKKLESIHIKTM